MTRRILSPALLALAMGPSAAFGGDAPSCHCFRDRTFDPARPSAADAYVLATTRNSLLSAALSVSKRTLVQAEMSGISPDNLWIAYWVARRAERDADDLLSRRSLGGSWNAALAGVDARRLGPTFEDALTRGAPDIGLASVAVDDVLASRLKVPDLSIAALRAAGAASSEAIVASFVSVRSGRSAVDLLRMVRKGSATWGSVLADAGLAPADVDRAIRQMLQ